MVAAAVAIVTAAAAAVAADDDYRSRKPRVKSFRSRDATSGASSHKSDCSTMLQYTCSHYFKNTVRARRTAQS